MAYTKPQVIAQNASSGSYAAGCPTTKPGKGAGFSDCLTTDSKRCEIGH